MINNLYIEDFYAFSSDVAGACTYGSDDICINLSEYGNRRAVI
jgi:hypothetical protein